jgi:hypothetical protein
MVKVTVYRVIVWNQSAGNSYVSRRMATEKGAAMMGGKIAPDTGVEIDSDQLEHGEEWTARDFASDDR